MGNYNTTKGDRRRHALASICYGLVIVYGKVPHQYIICQSQLSRPIRSRIVTGSLRQSHPFSQ